MEKEMNFAQMIVAALVVMIVFVGAFVVTAPAFAEETRTVFVVGFDFATAEVILEDEDGFLWSCPFGENSWAFGDEYQLVISDGQAEICE